MKEYSKPFLNIDKQISLLKERGLSVPDEDAARCFLKDISYYHLSIYAKAFQDEKDIFQDETTFENILDLYNFDKKLRLLLMGVLERIEMSLKCVLIYEISNNKNDNYWYTKKSNFKEEENVDELLENVKKSKEIYIQHFYKKYLSSEYPPVWMFFEDLSFGKCSRLTRNLHENDRQVIASKYKMSKKAVIQMFYYLAHLRNTCAHHSRVWNRGFTIKVSPYKKHDEVFRDIRVDSLFAYIIVIQIFIQKIDPTSSWLEELAQLIEEYDINIYRMGFPDDWSDRLQSVK